MLEQIGAYGAKVRPRLAMQGTGGGSRHIGAAFPIQPGSVSPMRSVPNHIPRPEYADNGEPGESAPLDLAFTMKRRLLEPVGRAGWLVRC